MRKNSLFKRGLSWMLTICMIAGMMVFPAGAAGNTWYVSPMGDDTADGTSETSALLNIYTAYQKAEDGDTIVLTGDFDQPVPVGEFNDNKDVTIDGDGHTVKYVGAANIDTTSNGLFKVNSGAVTFKDLTIDMDMHSSAKSGRALYAGQNAYVVLDGCTLENGNYVDNTLGGGAIYVHSGAEVVVTDSILTGNTSAQSGGAIFVADGGELTINGSTSISGNSAKDGAALYVAKDGISHIEDNAEITNNTATNAGGGVFLAQGSSNTVAGDVIITNNKVGGAQNNVYLQNTEAQQVTVDTNKVATFDCSALTSGADIGITCQNPNYYRLVSLPVGYTITKADEAGWTYDDGTYDIRLMTREGVTGLFLYYHAIPVTYTGTENLVPSSGITGLDINGEDTVNYPAEIATDGDMGANTPSSGDYVMNVTVDDNFYRIPETIELTADGRTLVDGTDYIWAPDYAAGEGTITILVDALEAMQQAGETLNVQVKADQYFSLTLNLSDVDIDLNGWFEDADDTSDVADAEVSNTGYTVQYDVATDPTKGTIIDSRDDTPVSDAVTVTLYEYNDGVSTLVGTTQTVGGHYDFSASYTLDSTKSYFITFDYARSNRVISKAYIQAEITSFPGHTIPAEAHVIAGGITDADIQYTVHDDHTATLIIPRNTISADTVIAIGTTETGHTVYFDANGGVCTVPSKSIVEGVSAYGALPDETQTTRTGYTFIGWFTQAVGGTEVTSSTVFDATDDVTLYAHWAPNGDRHYEIRQWVEFLDDGVNEKCESTTPKATENGKTYYLYQTDAYDNGVADADDMDISALVLSVMSSTTYDWWTVDGFSVNTNSQLTGLHVNADGSSVYDIYYDRNVYDVTLDAGDNAEANGGDATIDSPTSDVVLQIPFGSEMGNDNHFDYSNGGPTVKPVLPGYDFVDWADADENVIRPDSIYTKTDDSTLHAEWSARTDTVYVVHFMLQNVGLNPVTNRIEAKDGEYVDCSIAVSVKHDANGNYVGLEARDYYLSDGTTKVKCYFGQGTTEEDVTIAAPALEGFNFARWENSIGESGALNAAPSVHIEPNDASLKNDLTSDTLDVESLVHDGDLGELFLYYDRVSNEVQFDAGEGSLPDQTTGDIPYGGDFQNQFPDDPTRPGHDFNGWVDGDGNPVDESTLTDDYTTEDGTLILYPTWTPRDYALTYVIAESAADGHSNSSFVPGDGGTASAVPSVENGYTDGRLVTYNSAVGTMPTNTKVGYTFQGWYLSLSPLEDQITSETIVSIDNVVIEDTVTPNAYEDTRPLYAYVTPNTYTITFNGGRSNGGVDATVPVATKEVVFDGPYGQPSALPVPTLTGYTFQGWYLDPNDPSTLVQNDTIYTIPNNVTLYAKWTPNVYRYTFVLNDSVDPDGKGSTPATLTSNGIVYDDPAVDETYDSVYENCFDFEASRIGYTFDGWALTRNGTPLTPVQIVSIAADATLYACWTPKTYDVVLNHNDGFSTGVADVVVTLPDALTFDANYSLSEIVTADMTPVLAGYDFGGWATVRNDKATIITDANWVASQSYVTDDDLTLYATWFAVITVDPDGGSFAPGSTAPFVPGSSDPTNINTDDLTTLPDVEKPGYTHDGWKDENGDPVTPDDLKGDNVPTTVKPIFKANVTFNANGGTVNGSATQTVKAESVTVLPTAIRSSYDFNGWYTAADGGTRLTLAEIQAITTPMTVFAHWTARQTGGGGGGGGGGGSVSKYDVDVIPSAHGKTTSDKYEASSGEKVTITTKPDGSYKVATISVTDSKGNKVNYTETSTGFWFRMPARDVTVEVTYKNLVGDILDTGDHREYIHGYTDGLVRPNNNMTRGEAAQMFYNLLLNKNVAGGKTFSDVPSTMWCAEAIRVTSAMGIVAGYTDGRFGPDDSITRAQFATMCVRFLESTGEKLTYTKSFNDVKAGDWFYDYVMTAAEHDWVNGYGNGYFGPNDKITRAQVMTLMNHMLGREADKEYVDSNMDTIHYFPDLRDPSIWYFYDVVEATTAHDYDTYESGEDWTGVR